MHYTEAHILGMAQGGYQTKYAFLFAPSESSLKADKVVHGRATIVLPQLQHRERTLTGPRISKSHRLQRAKQRCIPPSIGHRLNRHTAFKARCGVYITQLLALSSNQRLIKAVVLFFVKRAVYISGFPFPIPRGHKCLTHIDGVRQYNRGRRVEKG